MGRLPSVSVWPKAEIGQGLTVFMLQGRRSAGGQCSGRDAIFIAPPAQNRTGGFPAYGLYGSFFVKGASRHFCRALLLHSFVQPAPRAFFHPDRTLPSPSRAAAVKDGASSAPPKACP